MSGAPAHTAHTETPPARQARDVMMFGQEVGRVLSDGRIVGRAEPFAKVFPSSRAVKRAVGLAAWGVLEDIALDARLDDRGRLVSETNVRRIAANLGVSKNTVSGHLAKLRDYGFVLHEERRDDESGRYESSRYVLDPSACIERFTTTPAGEAGRATQSDQPGAAEAVARRGGPCPNGWDTGAEAPCPNNQDTATVSQSSGSRVLGQKNRSVVVDEEEQQQHGRCELDEGQRAAVEVLCGVGVSSDVARRLAEQQPSERIQAAVTAARTQQVRNPAGWIVSALRQGWDFSLATAERPMSPARQQRTGDDAAAQAQARQVRDRERERVRADGWAQAVSAALDDRVLATAVDRLTEPLPGLGRRSVPIARAQLIRWAIAVAHRRRGQDLAAALAADLAFGPTPPGDEGPGQADPPSVAGTCPGDLGERIAACLGHLQKPCTTDAQGGSS